MTIRIAERLHPFSHLPGALALLPKTDLVVQFFPVRICFFRCGEAETLFFLDWDIAGPVQEFTAELDLEHSCLRAYGKSAKGYFRYVMRHQTDGVAVHLEKCPQPFLQCRLSSSGQSYRLAKGENVLIPVSFSGQIPLLSRERLSLGMHKQQDWDLLKRRMEFKEIFPIWMRLGQISPQLPPFAAAKGALRLMQQCAEYIDGGRKQEVLLLFEKLFLAGFEGINVPRLFDTEHQGLLAEEAPEKGDPSPLLLLTEGAALIRSLFFKEELGALYFLPCLPSDFHAGRFIHVQTRAGDQVDFEWNKKQLGGIKLHAYATCTMHLHVSRHLRKCRIRSSIRDRGIELAIEEGKLLLDVQAKQPVIIDRFQK
ncbi:MAG TPA: hypothetical protein VGJ00_04820 [Rhabdochlamydiaceae bacterium]|jgi:hypothetical protein